MSRLQPVRGTADLLPDSMAKHRLVINAAFTASARYGFQEMATPIFEFSEVFSRPLGESSDVVTKENYSFADRGGEMLTLRPENTAGVVRAMISGGLTQSLPLKYFYAFSVLLSDVFMTRLAVNPLRILVSTFACFCALL